MAQTSTTNQQIITEVLAPTRCCGRQRPSYQAGNENIVHGADSFLCPAPKGEVEGLERALSSLVQSPHLNPDELRSSGYYHYFYFAGILYTRSWFKSSTDGTMLPILQRKILRLREIKNPA